MADCRALQIVLSFFHADGAGLPVERLQLGLYRVSSNHGLLSLWREVFFLLLQFRVFLWYTFFSGMFGFDEYMFILLKTK